MGSAILHEVIRAVFSEKATFEQRFELSKRKNNNRLRGKGLYLCSLLESSQLLLKKASMKISISPRPSVSESVLSGCQLQNGPGHRAKWVLISYNPHKSIREILWLILKIRLLGFIGLRNQPKVLKSKWQVEIHFWVYARDSTSPYSPAF